MENNDFKKNLQMREEREEKAKRDAQLKAPYRIAAGQVLLNDPTLIWVWLIFR